MRTVLLIVSFFAMLISPDESAKSGPAEQVPDWNSELDIRIGSLDDPDYSLTRFVTLVVGSNGDMYTLHPREQVVRHFSVDGTFLRFIGRRGEGPGEFENAFSMGWVADTLWVLDRRGSRFSQFNPSGEFLGSFSVPFRRPDDPMSSWPPQATGLLTDGTVYGSSLAPTRLVANGTVGSRSRVLLSRDGMVTRTLVPIDLEHAVWAIGDPDNPRQFGGFSDQPFSDGSISDFVPGERALMLLERDAPTGPDDAQVSLMKVSFEGDTIWARRLPFDPDPVTRAEVDSILDDMAVRVSERGMRNVSRGQAREWAEMGLYRPEFKPGISEMLMGRNGSIWLCETEERAGGTSWLVLNTHGEVLGRVSLPQGLTVMVVDQEYVWGLETDEFDVSYLVRYRILRS